MKYYVYELIDPRNNKVFYVGKGKGKRVFEHEKEAIKGSMHRKCVLIREILNSNLKVINKIVKYFDEEQKAYDYEVKLISKIGLSCIAIPARSLSIPLNKTLRCNKQIN